MQAKQLQKPACAQEKSIWRIEDRQASWTNRVAECYEYGLPVASCKSWLEDIKRNPEKKEEFKEKNRVFVDQVVEYQQIYFSGTKIRNGVDMFTGDGMFYERLRTFIPGMYALDFAKQNIDKLKERFPDLTSRFIYLPAHQVLKRKKPAPDEKWGFTRGDLDYVNAARGLLHVPPSKHGRAGEWGRVLASLVAILKPGGHLAITELFRNELPLGRPENEGTWYRYREEYEHFLTSKRMRLTDVSPIFWYDYDPCQTIIFQKV